MSVIMWLLLLPIWGTVVRSNGLPDPLHPARLLLHRRVHAPLPGAVHRYKGALYFKPGGGGGNPEVSPHQL